MELRARSIFKYEDKSCVSLSSGLLQQLLICVLHRLPFRPCIMAYDLLFHIFIATPVCHFLLTDKRINGGSRTYGLLITIGFLVAVALVTTAIDQRNQPPNYYQILDVDINASAADIKRAYKTMSLRSHPDKNPSANAANEFQAISTAYDTLTDAEQRRQYDRFGPPPSNAAARPPINNPTQQMFDMAIFYAVWSALTYILCLSKEQAAGRSWSYVILFLMAIAEYQLLFTLSNPLEFLSVLPFFRRITIFELIRFLHTLYPAIMNGARTLSAFLFIDKDEQMLQLLAAVLTTNNMIIQGIGSLSVAGPSGRVIAGNPLLNGEQKDNGSGMSALPLSASLKSQQNKIGRLQHELEETKHGRRGWGIPTWSIPIGIYILINYVLPYFNTPPTVPTQHTGSSRRA